MRQYAKLPKAFGKRKTAMIAKVLVLVAVLSWVPLAHSEEIRPGVLRTPEARFVDLEGYPFDAHYMEIDGMRVHYLDEGARDGEPILLIHREPNWSYLFRKMIPILVGAGGNHRSQLRLLTLGEPRSESAPALNVLAELFRRIALAGPPTSLSAHANPSVINPNTSS